MTAANKPPSSSPAVWHGSDSNIVTALRFTRCATQLFLIFHHTLTQLISVAKLSILSAPPPLGCRRFSNHLWCTEHRDAPKQQLSSVSHCCRSFLWSPLALSQLIALNRLSLKASFLCHVFNKYGVWFVGSFVQLASSNLFIPRHTVTPSVLMRRNWCSFVWNVFNRCQ